MSHRSFVAVVSISLVLVSCGSPDPLENGELGKSDETSAVEPVETRVPPDWTQSESTMPIEECKIPDGRPVSMKTLNPGEVSLGANGKSNVGFPISPDIIPSNGVANLAVIPVTFLDLGKTPVDPMSEIAPQLEKMTGWSEFWSQGSFRYQFQVVDDWVVIPAQSSDYAIGREPTVYSDGEAREDSPFVKLANAVVSATGDRIDWESAHGFLVFWPPTIEEIESSWGGGGNDSIRTPVGDRRLFYWGTGRYHNQPSGNLIAEVKQDYLWSYWIHEMLHSQGVNGHAPGNGFATGIGQNQYPQGDGLKYSGALDAWSLFLLGWIRDEQVLCIDGREPGKDSFAILTPQEISGGERKMVVIRTGDHDGIVVESRRPIGYSERWGADDSGIFVYSLNLRVMNDRSGESTGLDCGNNPEFEKWAYYLPPNNDERLHDSCFFSDFIVREGDFVSHAGARVELVFSGEDLDYVRITRDQE